MEVELTPAQYEELRVLVGALTNVQNQGSVSGEITIGSTKVEYNAEEVKFTISS